MHVYVRVWRRVGGSKRARSWFLLEGFDEIRQCPGRARDDRLGDRTARGATRSWVPMPHINPRHGNRRSTMVGKTNGEAQGTAGARRMAYMRRKEGTGSDGQRGRTHLHTSRKQRVGRCRVRLARCGHSKPKRMAPGPEAGKSAPFTRTEIIF